MAYDDAKIVREYFKIERTKVHTRKWRLRSVSTRYLNSVFHKRPGVYNVKLTDKAIVPPVKTEQAARAGLMTSRQE